MSVVDYVQYLKELMKKGDMLSVWESANGPEEFSRWLDSLTDFREVTMSEFKMTWLKFQDSLRKNNLVLDRTKGNVRAVPPNWKSVAGTISYLLRNVLLPDMEARAAMQSLTKGGVAQSTGGTLVAAQSPSAQNTTTGTPALTSKQRQALALQQAFGKLHLLAVGIDDYEKASHFQNLKTCSADAAGVKAIFEDTHQLNADKSKLELLTTKTASRPSRGTIILKLRELANNAGPENRILYFHSGHGTYIESQGNRTFYLVPADAYSEDDPEALLPIEMVKSILSKSEAKQKLIILDSCWSGPDTANLKGPLAGISPQFLEEYLRKAKGVVILSACAYDQTATTQSPSVKYSLFSHYLIHALSGQVPEIFDDQLLTMSSLSQYLSVQVQKTAKSQHRVQTPGLKTSHLNELIIGNFRASIINMDSWDPSESPVDAIVFSDESDLRVTDVLTQMKNWTKYSEGLIVKMVNQQLDTYLEDDFGQISTKLCSSLGYNHHDITIEECSLQFPGADYSVRYESDEKKKGLLIHEVRFGKSFLEEPNKIPLALSALGLQPSEMTVELSNKLDPLSTIPGLTASQWTITSQLPAKVCARHKDGITIEFRPQSIAFSGFSPSELWGSSTNKAKASLIAGAMTLIGKRG